MSPMFNPPHPGETIREDILPGLGLSITEAARQLGVSRVALSRVINGKTAISANMAIRLEAWLNGPDHGPSAESWLRGQLAYDVWQAKQAPPLRAALRPRAAGVSRSRSLRRQKT
ncbi:MAG: HigA family addiction module antitoxin [Gammaproteobacteria bacterium]